MQHCSFSGTFNEQINAESGTDIRGQRLENFRGVNVRTHENTESHSSQLTSRHLVSVHRRWLRFYRTTTHRLSAHCSRTKHGLSPSTRMQIPPHVNSWAIQSTITENKADRTKMASNKWTARICIFLVWGGAVSTEARWSSNDIICKLTCIHSNYAFQLLMATKTCVSYRMHM